MASKYHAEIFGDRFQRPLQPVSDVISRAASEKDALLGALLAERALAAGRDAPDQRASGLIFLEVTCGDDADAKSNGVARRALEDCLGLREGAGPVARARSGL